ncbi:MAG: formylglycine-generating enzyme family protein [Deltaproteobacteria bacterium]|nr:formylglycine-generating enzyme family protein [Deltaproteobacteria bacterium]
MLFKPKWYSMLPEHLKSKNERIIESIESLRKKYELPHEMIYVGVAATPWAVRMAQEDCLRQYRSQMPNASEKELWENVLLSRMLIKKAAGDIPVGPWIHPLSGEEILSMIDNRGAICANFKTWGDVVEYIVSIERDEGTYLDPSGILNELNVLLESETEQSINDEKWSETIDDIDKVPSRYFLESHFADTGIPMEFTSPILKAKFVLIPAGTFMMGSPSDESDRDNEETLHEVTISRSFYMQTTEVTQGQWKKVMGSNPSEFINCGDDCPVEQVSWNVVQDFIGRLNRQEGTDKYRLPTEAEWEYACRAGSTTAYYFGNDPSSLGEYAWYIENSGYNTRPVGQKKPNIWGLYDMYGNVFEWVNDWYGEYPSGSVTDPEGLSSGSRRGHRGGSWGGDVMECRSACRFCDDPDNCDGLLGFRLLRE